MELKSIKVTKILDFAAAHLLPTYEGTCRNLHGHEWKLEVTLKGTINPETHMLMDFKILKEILNERIISKLDHSFINDRVPYPTAENMVLFIWKTMSDIKELYSIKLWETPTSYVEISVDDFAPEE